MREPGVGLGYAVMEVVKDSIASPSTLFLKIKSGRLRHPVLVIFGMAAAVSLLKAFMWGSALSGLHQNFFPDSFLNTVLSLLGNPVFAWLFSYLMYFALLLCVYFICTSVFASTLEIGNLFVAVMALSGLGVIMQVVACISSFLLSPAILLIVGYVLYVWILCLTVKAVEVLSSLSMLKAAVSVLAPFIVLFAIGGMVILAPYLSWLSPQAR